MPTLVRQPTAETLASQWPSLSANARAAAFNSLPRGEMDDLFLQLDPREQAQLNLDTHASP
jgi:hypothetical protein